MKIVMLDRATLGYDLDISELDKCGDTVIYDRTLPEETVHRVKNADAVFLNKVKLTGEILAQCRNLKLICEAATGYDNIDIDFCRENGIAVCNVPGYSANSVSQVTVAMALSLACRLGEYRRFTASGDYTKSGIQNRLTPVFHELNGKTWGIVGYGNIGSRVADAARALGCRVLAFKRRPVCGVECADIETVLSKSDVISVHLPLSCDTRNIIDKKRISMIKKNAIFINASRGLVADEEALCSAVKEGKLGGLGIDVYSEEPFRADSPYYEIKNFDNVCLTPHMAWGAYEARERCFKIMLENMKAFFGGEIKNRVEL